MIKNEKYDVTGMSCAACSAHINKAVSQVEGVKEANVNLLTNSMTVSYEDSATPEIICKSRLTIRHSESSLIASE